MFRKNTIISWRRYSLSNLAEKTDGKRILIWGYGREGQSTKHFLRRCCSPSSVEIFEGKRDGFHEEAYDLIVKSPGIIMEEDHPKYTSQTEIFLEAYRDQVIGITGTKGKSTTSAMLAHVLSECTDKDVILLGNIGEPCLDYYDAVKENTVIVFEMSCHQLAHTTVSPHIAVFLNLYEEHLDYYGTVEKYFAAKKRIAEYQTEKDYLYLGEDVPEFAAKAKTERIRRSDAGDYDLSIYGTHNCFNAEFVKRIAADRFGASEEAIRKSLKTFKGLPHRLQFIGERDGVRYFDDSISTIPNATIEALSAIPDVGTVLIGGMDRGIDYDPLLECVRKHKEIDFIFSYDSGRRMYQKVKDLPNVCYIETLKDAVEQAKLVTPKGKACLLSPASASYGYFKNFEQRGEIFKETVFG